MRRRDFVKGTFAGAATAGLTACGTGSSGGSDGSSVAEAPPDVRWRLASTFPGSLDTIFGAAATLATRLEQLTAGRFRVRVYEAGEIVPPLEVLDAVQQGSVEMGHGASYYFIGKNPAMAFDCAVPFGLTARQHLAWLTRSGGLELMRGVFADFNILNFPGGNTGVQMGGWFRRPVSSLAELRGLKMRIPGLGGEVMSALGVTVQLLAGGEIYPALERGAIDATEWVGPYDDLKLGFHQVAKHYYYPGWWEPGPALSFYVNRDAYAALPETYRAALEVACHDAGMRMLSDYDAKNPQALETLVTEHGVALARYSDDIMSAAREASESILEQFASGDESFRTIFRHWDAFRKKSNRWLATAERAYADFAFGGA
jgi:TRAP-type mannitol/chloroaromatic compound transport system substrate-binding protein